MVIQKNAHIEKLAVLQRKPNREYALNIIRDIAHQVSYLMRENKLRVGQLVEFYPKNKRLLGMNVNGGSKIMLRLRHPNDESEFLSRESILATMLHELTHNLFGPHNVSFYKKLDEFMGRQWTIEQQGLFDSFIGTGRKLGMQPKSRFGPRRLGSAVGSDQSSLRFRDKTPREMAYLAAEKRARDARWCAESEKSETVEPLAENLDFIEVESDSDLDPKDKDLKKNSSKPEVIEIIDLTCASDSESACP